MRRAVCGIAVLFALSPGQAKALGAALRDDVPDVSTEAVLLVARADDTYLEERLESAADRDWYRLEAVVGGDYEVHTEVLNNTALDARLTVYAPDGQTVVAANEHYQRNAGPLRLVDALVRFVAAAPGTHYILVEAASEAGAQGYLLFARRYGLRVGAPMPDRLEGAGEPILQDDAPPGTADTGDAYALDIVAGQVIDASVTFRRTLAPGAVALRLMQGETVVASATWEDAKTLRLGTPVTASARYALRLDNPGKTAVDYTLLLRYDSGALEPNETPAAAADAGALRGVAGVALSATGTDWFRFSALSAEFVGVEVFARRIGSPLATSLVVQDSSGTVLGAVLDSEGADPAVAVPIAEDGTVLVGIAARDVTEGTYEIRLTEHVDAYEPNDTLVAPPPFVPHGRLQAGIWPGQDRDCYAVRAEAGETLVFDVDADRREGVPFASQIDARMTLLDHEGRVLAYNENRAPGTRDPRLRWTTPHGGNLIVCIEDAPRDRNAPVYPYELTIRREGDMDFDGRFSWRDIFRLARQWQRRGPDELTGDYRCDEADLALLLLVARR